MERSAPKFTERLGGDRNQKTIWSGLGLVVLIQRRATICSTWP
jgi:hypothetical protein